MFHGTSYIVYLFMITNFKRLSKLLITYLNLFNRISLELQLRISSAMVNKPNWIGTITYRDNYPFEIKKNSQVF